MSRDYNFKIGQKIKTRDPHLNIWVNGEVLDKTSKSILVHWADMPEAVWHYPADYSGFRVA